MLSSLSVRPPDGVVLVEVAVEERLVAGALAQTSGDFREHRVPHEADEFGSARGVQRRRVRERIAVQ